MAGYGFPRQAPKSATHGADKIGAARRFQNPAGTFQPRRDGSVKRVDGYPMHSPGLNEKNLGPKPRPHRGNIALDGAPKDHQDIPAHPGMVHKAKDGQHWTGLSPTEVHAVLNDEREPTSPAIGYKELPAPEAAFGQRSRNQNGEVTPGSPGQHAARIFASP